MGILNTGTLDSLNSSLSVSEISNFGTLSFIITGTWVGTITFQGSVDGTNFNDIYSQSISTNLLSKTTTSNGQFIINIAGLKSFKVLMSAYTSGSASVEIQGSANSGFIRSTSTLLNSSGNAISSDTYGSNNNLLVNIGEGNQIDAVGRIRVSDSDLIESLHFSNTNHPLLVNSAITGSATNTFNSSTSSLRMTTTTSSSDSIVVQTKRYFRYNPGRSYLVTISGNVGAKKSNTQQRLGYFDANNGLFFEQTSTDLAVVVRTNTSGSPVDTRVIQSNWNIDKLDGTGASGINLDTSKHNLYVIDFLWHGAGRIRYGIFYNGRIRYCHEINMANTNTTPFMRTPCLPLRCELTNTGTTASTTTFDLVCFAYQKEASDTLTAPYIFSTSTVATSTSVGNTILPILAIRPKATFNSITNRVPIIPRNIQVAANQNLIYVVIYLNPTLTGASFSSVDSNSAVEFDTASTAVSGGTKLREFYVPASTSLTSTITSEVIASMELISIGLDIAGSTQDILVIAARSTAGGTSTWAQIDWQEFQ